MLGSPYSKTRFFNQCRYVFCSAFIILFLAACESTGSSRNVSVGPSVGPAVDSNKPLANLPYRSDIYLDVSIPVFDPGIPTDYDELKDKSIWPQLRRSEANRFAQKTKDAMQKIGSFGAINVVPNASTTSELYVLGKIKESNSEKVSLEIDVRDISGRSWGRKTFKHTVSQGFYRDKANKGKDSYDPIFDDIAYYVYKLLIKASEEKKQELKHLADIRFAQSFAPEAFSAYVSQDRNGYYHLTGLPDQQLPMLKRIDSLRVQDQLFVDRIQTQYQGFVAKTDSSYILWQEATLPEVVGARQNRNRAIASGILGAAVLIAAGVQATKSDNSRLEEVLSGVAGVGGAILIGNSFNKSKEAKEHRAAIDEYGESLDIAMDPLIMELNEQSIELSGTAEEQYQQWRAHLKRIYELEATPDVIL